MDESGSTNMLFGMLVRRANAERPRPADAAPDNAPRSRKTTLAVVGASLFTLVWLMVTIG